MGGATAAVRLHRTDPEPAGPLTFGNLAIFREQYRATIGGRPVKLTFREFELLALLAARVDRVVQYREVEEALWRKRDADLRGRTTVLVCRLRRKLSGMAPYRIETVRRVGYRLTMPFPGPARRAGLDRG